MGLLIGIGGINSRRSLAKDKLHFTPSLHVMKEGVRIVAGLRTSKEGATFKLGYPAPAPEGIVLTPDAVGDNPITYYWKAAFGDFRLSSYRSLWSEEGTVTIGDETTEIIANYDQKMLPFWTNTCQLLIGQSSDNYSINKRIGLISPGNPVWGFNGTFNENNTATNIEAKPIKHHPIPDTSQAPAPTNISIVPDAVGDNPVTWYYKVIQVTSEYKACELSEEQFYQQGDSTTELIFNLDHIDYDDMDFFFIMKGTTPGIYTNIVMADFTAPDTIVPITDVQLPYDLLSGADIPFGEEVINESFTSTEPILLPIYDNELFIILDNKLLFLEAPDYGNPQDTDKDNVYRVFVVATHEGDIAEAVIEVEVLEIEEE